MILVQDAHIQICHLWEYSRTPSTLETRQLEHLCCCEDCIGVAWICQSSESLQEAKARLKKHGITGE